MKQRSVPLSETTGFEVTASGNYVLRDYAEPGLADYICLSKGEAYALWRELGKDFAEEPPR